MSQLRSQLDSALRARHAAEREAQTAQGQRAEESTRAKVRPQMGESGCTKALGIQLKRTDTSCSAWSKFGVRWAAWKAARLLSRNMAV